MSINHQKSHHLQSELTTIALFWIAFWVAMTASITLAPNPALAAKLKRPSPPPRSEKYSATEGAIEAPTPAKPRPAFDTVPPEQADSIIRRLKLVEVLIRDHGRAYDYRAHTNQELEGVLTDLQAIHNSAGSPAPRSQPAAQAPAAMPPDT